MLLKGAVKYQSFLLVTSTKPPKILSNSDIFGQQEKCGQNLISFNGFLSKWLAAPLAKSYP